MNKEFLHMQKLAGIISESEYQAKLNESKLNENEGVRSVYYIDRAYGGPEEGGWWYDVYEYICPVGDIEYQFTPEEAETLNSGEMVYDNSSVGGGAGYRIMDEKHPKELDGTDTYEPYS